MEIDSSYTRIYGTLRILKLTGKRHKVLFPYLCFVLNYVINFQFNIDILCVSKFGIVLCTFVVPQLVLNYVINFQAIDVSVRVSKFGIGNSDLLSDAGRCHTSRRAGHMRAGEILLVSSGGIADRSVGFGLHRFLDQSTHTGQCLPGVNCFACNHKLR